MDATEARVHRVETAKKGEPFYILFLHPGMQLHEDGTRWIAELATRLSPTHQRNVAYALAHWHTFCLGIGIDYARASVDDLLTYKMAMESVVSEATGERLSAGTISQRIHVISGYYAHGDSAGWNLTSLDLRHALRRIQSAGGRPEEEKHATPIGKSSSRYAPRSERAETDIRPLDVEPLKQLLTQLGPSEQQVDQGSSTATRDRLIAEWLCYVGLRIEEVLGRKDTYGSVRKQKRGLTIHQIRELAADPHLPFGHQIVGVVGKYGKTRQVAVPNWLIVRTQKYIEGERAAAVGHMNMPTSRVFVSGRLAGTSDRGRPLSVRRYQAVFTSACMKSGLTKLVEKQLRGSNQTRLIPVARHSPHDLRHTYAVMTYFAEVALGNSEPWKPIQAQLGHRHLQTTVDTYLAFVSAHGQWRDMRRMSVRELAGVANE